MPGARKVSDRQVAELVSWMEKHPLQARGTQLGISQAKQKSASLWDELTSHLNAVGDGVTKSSKEWRQYWNDMKYKIKKKGSAMRQYCSGTGGGPAWDVRWSPTEEKILSIVGVQSVLGNPNVRIDVDMGLTLPLQSQSSADYSQLTVSEKYSEPSTSQFMVQPSEVDGSLYCQPPAAPTHFQSTPPAEHSRPTYSEPSTSHSEFLLSETDGSLYCRPKAAPSRRPDSRAPAEHSRPTYSEPSTSHSEFLLSETDGSLYCRPKAAPSPRPDSRAPAEHSRPTYSEPSTSHSAVLLSERDGSLHCRPKAAPSRRSESRPLKRKHTARSVDGRARKSISNLAPPQWAMELENCRVAEERQRRELEEQRLNIEKRRLEIEERRLKVEEQRLEEDRLWRSEEKLWRCELLSTISNILPPPPQFR